MARKHRKHFTDITKFKDIKVEIKYEDIVKKYADQDRRTLTHVSPRSDRPGRAHHYYQGWRVEYHDENERFGAVVWNQTDWQLTWLLEHGHILNNRPGSWRSLSRTREFPHIKETFDNSKPDFIKAMRNVPIKVKIT